MIVKPEELKPGSFYVTYEDSERAAMRNIFLCLSRRTNGNVTYVTWMRGDQFRQDTYVNHGWYAITKVEDE